MEQGVLKNLVIEIREDFQIPPYFPDASLERFAKEGEAYLGALNVECDIETDLTYRSLLKNYVYYALHHRIDEFEQNYASMILSWQLNTELPIEKEGGTSDE